MTDETGTPAAETVAEPSLAEFSSEFFGKTEAPVEEAPVEETPPVEEATPEDDTLADETSEDTSEADEESEPEVKPKKKSVQERINELTAKAREAERRENAERIAREAFEQKLNDAIAKIDQKKEPEPKPVKVGGPSPDDTNEDGTEKYPLGEFDPLFIRDITKHTFEELKAESDKEEQQRREQATLESQKTALQSQWAEKVEASLETLPDFNEKIQSLSDVTDTISPEFGEYLAATIMSMDRGPELLYYLADHPDEAKQIVSSSPVSATIALGRIEGRLPSKKETTPPKVSQAPEPPVARNKGTGQFESRDPNDLARFSKEFFSTK